MARAVVHIGTEKTGTSQIQRFLSDNVERLAEHGMRYPAFLDQLNHTKLVVGFTQGHQDIHRQFDLVDESSTASFLTSLAETFDAQIPRGSDDRWIFSSEHLASRFRAATQVDAFRDWMSTWFSEIEIVVYLRRQDFMASSSYSTFVRSGGTATWDLDNLTGDYFDLRGIVSRWSSAFGSDRVVVRPYFESMVADGSLIPDLLTTVALPPDDDWHLQPELANQRLSQDAIYVLRMINQQLKTRISRVPIDRGPVVDLLVQLTPGPGWRFPLSVTREVARHFRVSNELLVTRLGATEPWNRWLGQEPVGGPDDPVPLPTETVVEILMTLAQDGLLTAPENDLPVGYEPTLGERLDSLCTRVNRRMRRRGEPTAPTS